MTTIIWTIEHVDFGTMSGKEEYKDFGTALRRYNELIRELHEREAAGEIKSWKVEW